MIANGYDTQEKIDAVMKEMLKEAHKEHTRKVKNGYRTLKDGTKKQKIANRKFKVDQSLAAYHNESFDGVGIVEPHFHFAHDPKLSFGKGYSELKEILNEIAEKRGLVFHFNEAVNDEDLSRANQIALKKASGLSWFIAKGTNEDLANAAKRESTLKSIEGFFEVTAERNLIAFRIKTMEKLKRRLKEIGADLNYEHKANGRTYNLAESYPLDLTKDDAELLKALRLKEYRKVVEHVRRDHILEREYYVYNHGFKSQTIDALKAAGFNMPFLEKELYEHSEIEGAKTKKQARREKPENAYIGHIKKCIIDAAVLAKSEKDFKDQFAQIGGFSNVKFKWKNEGETATKKRRKIGLEFQTAEGKPFRFFFEANGVDYMRDILDKIRVNVKVKRVDDAEQISADQGKSQYEYLQRHIEEIVMGAESKKAAKGKKPKERKKKKAADQPQAKKDATAYPAYVVPRRRTIDYIKKHHRRHRTTVIDIGREKYMFLKIYVPHEFNSRRYSQTTLNAAKVLRGAHYAQSRSGKIITINTKTARIVDYQDENTIKLSAASNEREAVAQMIALAQLKGWKLTEIQARGTKKFKEEFLRQKMALINEEVRQARRDADEQVAKKNEGFVKIDERRSQSAVKDKTAVKEGQTSDELKKQRERDFSNKVAVAFADAAKIYELPKSKSVLKRGNGELQKKIKYLDDIDRIGKATEKEKAELTALQHLSYLQNHEKYNRSAADAEANDRDYSRDITYATKHGLPTYEKYLELKKEQKQKGKEQAADQRRQEQERHDDQDQDEGYGRGVYL